MLKTRTIARNSSDCGLMVAVADAHTAAEVASGLAAEASQWSARAAAGADEAAEVLNGAMRARLAARQAERCDTAAEAWGCARLAWAAVTSALEASARLNAEIAEVLAAA